MKSYYAKHICIIINLLVTATVSSQYNWKLSKDRDGIKVYETSTPTSNIKSIKVECNLPGNFDKLMSILGNVSLHKAWVYNNKTSYILKQVSPTEFYYYTETNLPWPMANRDAAMHLTMVLDSLNGVLKIHAISEHDYVPVNKGKVRMTKSSVNWYVTMPTKDTLDITYTIDADPGGSIPAWMANMFVDKGPYESFKKLTMLLKK